MIKYEKTSHSFQLSHEHQCLEHMADEIQELVETMIKDEVARGMSLSEAEKIAIIRNDRNRLMQIIMDSDVLDSVIKDENVYLADDEL